MEKHEYKNCVITVENDDFIENPIKEWETGFSILLHTTNFNFGDIESVPVDYVVRYPLYALNHSGIVLSISDFHDRWDSGQIGYIYQIDKDMSDTAINGFILIMNQYLNGEVYSYNIEYNNHHVDSLSGLYGIDYAINEAKDYIDNLTDKDFDSYKITDMIIKMEEIEKSMEVIRAYNSNTIENDLIENILYLFKEQSIPTILDILKQNNK